MRQAEDQVVADRGIANLPRTVGYLPYALVGLHPVDGFLHQRIVILYPETAAPKSQVVQDLQMLPGSVVRVGFEPQFVALGQCRVLHDAID